MSFVDIPVFSLLREKLNWHQARQKLLAENVANADTPGFVPTDLKPLDATGKKAAMPSVGTSITNRGHIAAALAGTGEFDQERSPGWETTPSANAVVLEEQMMKVAENQMDYQAATALYSRGLALLRTAVRSS